MKASKARRHAYQKFVLRLLVAGSAVYVGALLSPGKSLRLAKTFQKFSSRELADLRRALRRLEAQRLIEIIEEAQEKRLTLTPRGEKRARPIFLDELAIPKPKRWDRRWRLVLFDIPEYLHVGRDVLRQTLQRLGFYQVQKSVFIHPYPCEQEIEALAKHLGFEKHIHCFVSDISKLSYRRHLAKHFGLPEAS